MIVTEEGRGKYFRARSMAFMRKFDVWMVRETKRPKLRLKSRETSRNVICEKIVRIVLSRVITLGRT